MAPTADSRRQRVTCLGCCALAIFALVSSTISWGPQWPAICAQGPSASAAAAAQGGKLHGCLRAAHIMQRKSFKGIHGTERLLLNAVAATPSQEDSSHKPLIPVNTQDIVLLILCFIILALAAGAGMGGGVLLVPLFSILNGFSFIQTVALSNIAIFTGGVANLLFNLPRKHPLRQGPLIDYELLLLVGPPIVMGSVAGSEMNYYIPSWITKTLVLLVLAPMTWRMVQKARFLWMAESELKQEAQTAAETAAAHKATDGVEAFSRGTSVLRSEANTGSGYADQESQDNIHTAAAAASIVSSRKLQKSFSLPQQSAACTSEWLPKQRRIQRSRSSASDRALDLSPQGILHTSNADLVRLLGPELMLLNSVAAAKATMEVQHSSRQLQKQISTRLSRGSSLGLTMLQSLRPGSSPSMTHPAQRSGSSSSSATVVPEHTAAAVSAALNPATHVVRPSASREHSQNCLDVAAATQILDEELGVEPTSAALASRSLGGGDVGDIDNRVHSPFQMHQEQLQHKRSLARCNSGGVRQGTLRSHQVSQLLDQPLSSKNLQWTGKGGGVGTEAGGELPCEAKHRCLLTHHQHCHHSPDLEQEMLEYITTKAAAQYPVIYIVVLLGTLLVVVAATLCAQYLLICGSWQYWVVILLPLPAMVGIWAFMRWRVLWRLGWQEHLDVVSQAEVAWTTWTTLVYPAGCIVVGLMAGLLGMGGGIIMAPMLLELGVNPATAAASSQVALLISACCAAIVYVVGHAVPKDYGISIAVIGLVGTFFGQTVISYIVRRSGRSSLLVFLLTLMFVLALGAAAAVLALAVAAIVQEPSLLTATKADQVCHT